MGFWSHHELLGVREEGGPALQDSEGLCVICAFSKEWVQVYTLRDESSSPMDWMLYCLGLYTTLATHSAILIEDRRHFPKVSHQSSISRLPALPWPIQCFQIQCLGWSLLLPPPPPPGCCSGQHLPRQASLDLCTLHPPSHTHMASKRPQSSDFSSYNRISDINPLF